MDQITQQNAANAEETASASEEMSAQAQNMKEQVGILAAQVGSSVGGESHTYQKAPSRTRKVSRITKTTNVKGKGNGASSPEALIPMGESRVDEHDEHMSDF